MAQVWSPYSSVPNDEWSWQKWGCVGKLASWVSAAAYTRLQIRCYVGKPIGPAAVIAHGCAHAFPACRGWRVKESKMTPLGVE